MDLLENIKQRPDFPLYLQGLMAYWEAEQARRKEFYELVHENMKAEFINGEISLHSPVKGKHWMACTNIGAYLTVFVNQNKLGRVGVEKVMIRCTRNDYEPDVVFFGKEKSDLFLPDQMLFPPCDLAVEVLSESTRHNDYGVKFQDYAAHGIMEYWIVDTDNKSVEQYFCENGAYKLHQKLSESGIIKSRAVAGFEIDVAGIF